MNIKFGGDLVITEGYNPNIDKELIDLFSYSDLNILNLECPVTDESENARIIKTGPYLKGSAPPIAATLKKLNVGLVTLANNHIMDYGLQGIEDTITFCKTNSVKYTGVGSTLKTAKLPFRREINGCKLSIINIAENEWACASDTTSGANPLDIIDNVNQIKEEKAVSDIVIIIAHGGNEYYDLPNPRIVKQYRFYADNGADLIIGHHTHCISGYEIYKGTPIFYSLGNFLFTKKSVFEKWYTGLVLEMDFNLNNGLTFKLHPVIQLKNDYSIRLANEKEKEPIISFIDSLNSLIQDEYKLKSNWDKFVKSMQSQYVRAYSPLNFISISFVKKVVIKLGIERVFVNEKHYKNILNHIRCESHWDASKHAIETLLKKMNVNDSNKLSRRKQL